MEFETNMLESYIIPCTNLCSFVCGGLNDSSPTARPSGISRHSEDGKDGAFGPELFGQLVKCSGGRRVGRPMSRIVGRMDITTDGFR